MNFFKKIGLDNFVLAIVGMVVLAYYFPQLGMMEKPFSLDKLSNSLISVIFFLYGVKMGPEKFKAGLSNIRMHFLIQGLVFIVFPLLVICLKDPLTKSLGYSMWLAVFYLSALPSTVSSSVVMVSIAKGNVPGAIFNASLSSLLGVLITPIWMSLYIQNSGSFTGLGSVILNLCLQIVLPIIIGLFLNKKWGEKAENRKNQLKYIDQGIILLIIYTSFSHTFSEGLLDQISNRSLLNLFYVVVCLFMVVMSLTYLLTRLFKLNIENTITTLFCGSKKSLVHGTAMSKVLFVAGSGGLMLLPIMMYHAFQIIVTSMMAKRFGQREEGALTKK